MRTPPRDAPLIGRRAALDVLVEAREASLDGRVRATLVTGEAGIGKSRLVREFLASVPDDSLVTVGLCVDLGADAPPFAGLPPAIPRNSRRPAGRSPHDHLPGGPAGLRAPG